MNLQDIEKLTGIYAAARAELADAVRVLEDEIAAAKRRKMARITRLAEATAEAYAELEAVIDDHPDLFDRPRTHLFHGVKVGLQKGKGGIEWADAARVCELIRRHFPEAAEQLIITREAPSKTALAALPAADLKRLGCSIVDAEDAVLIKPTDSEIDRLVDALLRDGLQEEVRACAA